MGYDTKPNLDCSKFEQRTEDALYLSGSTFIYNNFTIESSSNFYIKTNGSIGQVLTYNNDGLSLWQSPVINIMNNNVYSCMNILTGLTSATNNILIGTNAGASITIGCDNIGFGYNTLNNNICGCYNVALNSYSLENNTVGCNNIAIGYRTMFLNCTGCNNIAIGNCAGFSNATGSSNVYIGKCAGFNELGSNKLHIGNCSTESLICGDFFNKTVKICGGLSATAIPSKISETQLIYYNQSDGSFKYGDDQVIPIFSAYTGTTQMMYNDVQDPTGFIDNNNIVVTYNSINRTINLINNNGIYYYYNGKKHYLGTSWTSSGHTNDSNAWYLFSSDGTNFLWKNNVWTFSDIQVAARPANVNWALRELHGVMAKDTHAEFHQNFGTYRKSGFGFTNGTYSLQPTSPVNADNTIGFEAGIIKDEDNETSINAWLEGSYTRLYFTGTSIHNFETGQTTIFRVGSVYPKYNPYNGSGFTETEMNSDEYANWYVIRIPVTADAGSQLYRAVILQPQFTYSTLTSAQSENPQNLYLGGLASWLAEYVLVERITMYTNSGYITAIGRVRIEALSVLSGNRYSQTNTTVGLGAITAGNVSVVPVSPFTSNNLQLLSDEYAIAINNNINSANNGLTKIGNGIVLGGTLTAITTNINLNNKNFVMSNGYLTMTSLSGTTNRMLQVNSNGIISANTEIISGKITNATVISLLTNESNWDVNGQYCGISITGTYEGQYYRDCNYYFFAYDDNDWTRMIRG